MRLAASTESPRGRTIRSITTAIAVAGFCTMVTAAPTAFAGNAPGDNGDVKVHESTTAVSDERDNPHVCTFYLDAFDFDTVQQVSWHIDQQPPTGTTADVLTGTLMLQNGIGHTVDYTLPNGHYKLYWNFAGENGAAKHKVFWVDCPATTGSAGSTGSTGNTGGNGGTGSTGATGTTGTMGSTGGSTGATGSTAGSTTGSAGGAATGTTGGTSTSGQQATGGLAHTGAGVLPYVGAVGVLGAAGGVLLRRARRSRV